MVVNSLSGRCPKCRGYLGGPCGPRPADLCDRHRFGLTWTTTTIRSPASCLRWTSAVQCCQAVSGEGVDECLLTWVRLFTILLWFVSRKLCRSLVRNRRVLHTLPRARRWVTPSVSCHGVWASSPGLNLANKSEVSAAQWPFRSFSDMCSLGKQSLACVRFPAGQELRMYCECLSFDKEFFMRPLVVNVHAFERSPAFASVTGDQAWEVRSLVKWVLSPLVFSLTSSLFFPFSFVIAGSWAGLYARAPSTQSTC